MQKAKQDTPATTPAGKHERDSKLPRLDNERRARSDKRYSTFL